MQIYKTLAVFFTIEPFCNQNMTLYMDKYIHTDYLITFHAVQLCLSAL